jgi:hypothetical protein
VQLSAPLTRCCADVFGWNNVVTIIALYHRQLSFEKINPIFILYFVILISLGFSKG